MRVCAHPTRNVALIVSDVTPRVKCVASQVRGVVSLVRYVAPEAIGVSSLVRDVIRLPLKQGCLLGEGC